MVTGCFSQVWRKTSSLFRLTQGLKTYLHWQPCHSDYYTHSPRKHQRATDSTAKEQLHSCVFPFLPSSLPFILTHLSLILFAVFTYLSPHFLPLESPNSNTSAVHFPCTLPLFALHGLDFPYRLPSICLHRFFITITCTTHLPLPYFLLLNIQMTCYP